MHRIVALTFFVVLGLIVGCSSQGSKVAANGGVLDVAPAAIPSAVPNAMPTPEPLTAAAPIPDAQPVAFSAPAPVQQAALITPAPAAPISATPAGQDAATGGKTYTVKKGDTLFAIAKTQLGSGRDWQKIVAANPGLTPAKLKAGQHITMP